MYIPSRKLNLILKKRESHIVLQQTEPVRLSDYVAGRFVSIPSKKGMKKAILKGLVYVNGELGTTARYLYGGELIELFESDDDQNRPVLEWPLEVIYEDDYLAVIVKLGGIEVSGNRFRTIENALPFNLKKSPLPDALSWPQPIHRLDYPTRGLLLIGKTASAVTALNQLFEHQKVKKVYHAVTIGEMDESGEIDVPIDGKHAFSRYEVLNIQPSPRFGVLNLVRLFPSTGRRHQLRIHLAGMGNPILGDQDYEVKGKILKGNGLYLHASSLSFEHPFKEELLSFEEELPKKFKRIFKNLRK